MFLKTLVEVTLLSEHAFALHHLFHMIVIQNTDDNPVVFISIGSPVDFHAVAGCIHLELLKIIGKMGDGVTLDAVGSIAQILPFRQVVRHSVALLAHAEESAVVTIHHLIVFQIGLCSL